MITSTRYKSGLYDELFAKADARLREVFGDEYEDGKGDVQHIESLEEYFAHLRDLVYGNSDVININDPDDLQRRFVFLKLPLDEPPVWIDANTRMISKKIEEEGYGYWEGGEYKQYKKGSNNPFFTNGIAVQGDETAETVYFEIDRYYDATDLSLMDIAVQWIHEEDLKGGGTPLYNYTPIIIKDVESNPGKLVFGWPISSDVTKRPGKINFSIRFYLAEGSEIKYSLSTQTQTFTINQTILADVGDGIGEIDNKIDLILGRLQNSIFAGYDDPECPIYILSSPDMNSDESKYIENINEDLVLYILYQTSQGKLSYRWDLYPSGSDSREEISPFTSLGSVVGEETDNIGYLLTEEYIPSIIHYYYVQYDNDNLPSYQMINVQNSDDFNLMKVEHNKLYIRCAVLRFNKVKDALKAGTLKVNVKNSYYSKDFVLSPDSNIRGDRVEKFSPEGQELYNNHYWIIVGPKEIMNDLLELDEAYVLNNETSTILTLNRTNELADNIDANTIGTWYYSETPDFSNKKIIASGLVDENILSYTIEDKREGYYRLDLYNNKNNTNSSIVENRTFAYELMDENALKDGSLTESENILISSTDDENKFIEISLINLPEYKYSEKNVEISISRIGSEEVLDESKYEIFNDQNKIRINTSIDNKGHLNNHRIALQVSFKVIMEKVFNNNGERTVLQTINSVDNAEEEDYGLSIVLYLTSL